MKTCFLALIIAVFVAGVANAGYGTNSFFVTVDGSWWEATNIQSASTNVECQPTEKDPSGHWGPVTQGSQLSIRFDKDIFTNGEPITGTIIWRNAGTNDLTYSSILGSDMDFNISITTDKEKHLHDRKGLPSAVNAHGTRWLPGTQYKFTSNLTDRYGLSKPGTYSVQVHRRIPRAGGNGVTDVSSGIATITIAP